MHTATCHSYHVILSCYPAMLSYHVILPCYPTLLSCHVILPCYPTMLSCHVILPCYPAMLSCHVIFLPCAPQYMLKYNDVKTKRGVDVGEHLLAYYQAQDGYFKDGSTILNSLKTWESKFKGQLNEVNRYWRCEIYNI